MGLYDDPNFNGIGGSLDKMLKADPNFSELIMIDDPIVDRSHRWAILINFVHSFQKSLVKHSGTA